MRHSRFSKQQIVEILNECASGRRVADTCRENGISTSTFYHWKTQYAAQGTPAPAHDLEVENRRLRQRLIDLSLAHEALKGELRRLRNRKEL